MAFPTVQAEAAIKQGIGNYTAPQLDISGMGYVSGDLAICVVGADSNNSDTSISMPTGWTSLYASTAGATQQIAVGYRFCDGTAAYETTTTLTFTINGATGERFTGRFYRITGHHASQPPEVQSAIGNDTSPNPPSFSPTGGAKDYLWIVAAAVDSYSSGVSKTFTGYPTSPDTFIGTGYDEADSTSTGSVTLGWARLSYNAATVDPGTFTLNESEQWDAVTIAVHPSNLLAGSVVKRFKPASSGIIRSVWIGAGRSKT